MWREARCFPPIFEDTRKPASPVPPRAGAPRDALHRANATCRSTKLSVDATLRCARRHPRPPARGRSREPTDSPPAVAVEHFSDCPTRYRRIFRPETRGGEAHGWANAQTTLPRVVKLALGVPCKVPLRS